MAEGRTQVYYQSDILNTFDNTGAVQPAEFVVDVPNNLVAQLELNWTTATHTPNIPTGIKLPKRLRPRHVVGVNSTGKRVRALVATTAAALWGDATGTWTYIDNFGATQTAHVTGFVGEAATV